MTYQELVNSVKSALDTIEGLNVELGRIEQYAPEDLPAATAIVTNETSTTLYGEGSSGSQQLTLEVIVFVAATNGWDSELYDLVESAKTKVLAAFDPDVIQLLSYNIDITADDDGQLPMGAGTIRLILQQIY